MKTCRCKQRKRRMSHQRQRYPFPAMQRTSREATTWPQRSSMTHPKHPRHEEDGTVLLRSVYPPSAVRQHGDKRKRIATDSEI